MIRLSYTSLNMLNGISHEWTNKMLGIPVPNYPFLSEGKEAHKIIQLHVSNEKKDKRLSGIEIEFPVVERVDFDENCKFSFEVNGYEIFGFIDGLDKKNKRFLEIKSSSQLWSMSKFKDSMQRKIYALALPDFKEAYIITCSKNPNEWERDKPKMYSLPLTQKDRDEALEWITKGISVLTKGDFSGGLDESGKCQGCFFNMERYSNLANCHFL